MPGCEQGPYATNAAGLPKVIHCCWFGHGEKSPLIQRCMASWREQMPDWQIKIWTEEDFNVGTVAYTAEAYNAKKYAFVSDYARFWILYHVGGVCLCTDVELLKPLDDLLEKTPRLMGFELANTVNPGSIMASPPGSSLIEEILQDYAALHFSNPDGSFNTKTIVAYTTEALRRHGFSGGNKLQEVAGFTLYPCEYFCPFEHETQMFLPTQNTRSFHHFAATWSPWYRRLRFRCIGLAARLLGRERYLALKAKLLRR